MKIPFAILAPALFASAIAFSASLSAQEKAPATPPAPSAPAAPAAAAPAATLPPAAEILAKYATAIGGKEAWQKIQSFEAKGRIEVPGQGMNGPMVTLMSQPNKMVTTIEFPGVGAIRTGFDGTVGWSLDRISGPRVMTGSELEMLARESQMMREADPTGRWDKIETVGEGDFGGFACWKIEGTRGSTKTTLWYEKESGLQRGSESMVPTPLGEIPVSNLIKEFREFEAPSGKVKVAVRTETTQMGQKMVTVIDSVVFDAVDAKAFELPAEIKTLLEPEPAEEGDAAAEPAAPTEPAQPKKEG